MEAKESLLHAYILRLVNFVKLNDSGNLLPKN